MNWVKSKVFLKECALVAFFVLNSFTVQLHTVINNEFLDSIFIQYNFVHDYGKEHKTLLWSILVYLQALLFLNIFFFVSRRRFKYSLLFLFYWISYSIIYEARGMVIDMEFISKDIKLYCIVGTVLFFLMYKVGQIIEKVPSEEPLKKGDWVVTLIVISLPIFEKLVWRMPNSMESLSFFGFRISAGEWVGVKELFWYVLTKMYVFVPLVICYLTIKRWWRYSLLFPILLVTFQLINGINPDVTYADEHEVWQAFPYLLAILVILLFLARSAYYQSLLLNIYKKAYSNIEKIVERKTEHEEHKLAMNKNRWLSFKKSKKGNIQDIIEFRESLEQELKKMNG